MTLGNHTVIDHVLNACRRAEVGPVVLAVPIGDPVATYARDQKLLCIEGPEQQVTLRFWQAALASGADHVVRITGDCPLMWPDLIRWLVGDHLRQRNDFTTVCRMPQRVPDGIDVEVISMALLRLCVNRSDEEASWSEHVTSYVYDRWEYLQGDWKLKAIPYPLPIEIKYSLDTMEDYERINAHLASTR
jgi:spore coat polysaccharide biosynthesis protein SpsF (cytidylyltransferase family)